MFEPVDGKFWEAVRQADPELFVNQALEYNR
jgi:hypothetical protein